jgi:hypothetical protein
VVPFIGDALYATGSGGTRSGALGVDQHLWLDLHSQGLTWLAYTGGVRIPRWRLRLDSHYAGAFAEGLATRHPQK